MWKYRTIVIVTAFAVIFAMTGMMSLNAVVKFSQGCPVSHTVKPHAKPSDSVVSPATADVAALPSAAPIVLEPTPVCYTDAIGSFCTPVILSIKAPPLRC
jgi:hypothetical protein